MLGVPQCLVDLSAPTILPPQVWVPITLHTLLSWICHAKRTQINKKRPDLAHFLNIAMLHYKICRWLKFGISPLRQCKPEWLRGAAVLDALSHTRASLSTWRSSAYAQTSSCVTQKTCVGSSTRPGWRSTAAARSPSPANDYGLTLCYGFTISGLMGGVSTYSIFFKWSNPRLFSVYFCLFKQTLQFLQQIIVKNVQPVSGTGIRTHNLLITSLIP